MGLDIVFMGTPEFAVPALERLCKSPHTVRAVVTAPDRPRGRGHAVQPTPVARAAKSLGLEVWKPESVRDEGFLDRLKCTGAHAVALVAYGKIIPPSVLEWPEFGCINVHPSLLPKYRGASPIHAPLLHGDSTTGVTTMFMDEGLDTGDILLQEEIPIEPDDNAGDLHDRLAALGADLLLTTFDGLEQGSLRRVPQDDEKATYAPKVVKEQIRWDMPSTQVAARIRGLSPFPGAYTYMGMARLKILRAVPGPLEVSLPPGAVVSLSEDGVVVACKEGSVVILEAQPEGKSPLTAGVFVGGYAAQIKAGFA